MPKIELLYLAGLFHDIGKGRGGDHSTLGAVDAERFCQRHGINMADTALVRWLVEAHLLMSTTAQRKDIYDPDVVLAFAQEVKSEMRLDYLYALTVADINATNPTLWNSWRATLLRHLYTETRKALRRGLESPLDRKIALETCQEAVFERLREHGVDEADCSWLGELFGDDFFLRHSATHIVQVGLAVAKHDPVTAPLVLVKNLRSHVEGEGASEISVYTYDRPSLFATMACALDELDLSIQQASIHTDQQGLCFNTFTVLDSDGTPLDGVATELSSNKRIERVLVERLGASGSTQPPSRRVPRQLKQLRIDTEVELSADQTPGSSVLTLVAADRPGLLAHVGEVFKDLQIAVTGAKIATLGERVDDVFWITEQDPNVGLSDERRQEIRATLRDRLDEKLAEA